MTKVNSSLVQCPRCDSRSERYGTCSGAEGSPHPVSLLIPIAPLRPATPPASGSLPQAARGVGNGPVAGRFVLFEPIDGEDVYITSWDTWDEAGAAFPIGGNAILRDDETGREWRKGYAYEWEAAST